MKTVTIYHNPACSKSREALSILAERGIDHEVVKYLETPPDRSTLMRLISASEDDPVAFVRTADRKFKDAGLHLAENARIEEVCDLLADHPEVLQRPIVAVRGRAVIARPPSRLLEIL